MLLEEGERIVVFPEGTYFKNRIGPGHSGMIRAIHTRAKEVAFIPVGIHYSGGRGQKDVKIRFGEPLSAGEGKSLEEFVVMAMKKIAELSDLPFQ